MTNLISKWMHRGCHPCATHAAVAISVLSFLVSGAALAVGCGKLSCECKHGKDHLQGKHPCKSSHENSGRTTPTAQSGDPAVEDVPFGSVNGTCGCEPLTPPEDLPRT